MATIVVSLFSMAFANIGTTHVRKAPGQLLQENVVLLLGAKGSVSASQTAVVDDWP